MVARGSEATGRYQSIAPATLPIRNPANDVISRTLSGWGTARGFGSRQSASF